jgi:hypothetical protein
VPSRVPNKSVPSKKFVALASYSWVPELSR